MMFRVSDIRTFDGAIEYLKESAKQFNSKEKLAGFVKSLDINLDEDGNYIDPDGKATLLYVR
ncbi:MAG: hypothetical protein HWE20_00650 [Gammaproteobacteria bacterium]|nr:hypothetical protein [Gammaproteobacteria bacterium]